MTIATYTASTAAALVAPAGTTPFFAITGSATQIYREESGYQWIPSDFGEIIFGFVLGFSLVANVCWPQLIRFF